MDEERRAIVVRMGAARYTTRDRAEESLVKAEDFSAMNEAFRALRVRLTWMGGACELPLVELGQG